MGLLDKKIPYKSHIYCHDCITYQQQLMSIVVNNNKEVLNLKEITPHNDSISRIGNVSAVYATKDKRFAACYGTLWNDDIAKQGSWDDWNTVVMGISDKVDMDSPCSLYELENDGFRSTNTSSLDFFDDLNEW